jgi:hypothetical protein
MPLYHACQQLHLDGHTLAVPVGASAHAYTKSVSRGRQWLEDAFEHARAGRSTSRRLAVYACDRPEFAARFALAEGGTMPNVYEVDMPGAKAAPMAIVDHLARQGTAWEPLTVALEEYWEFTKSWKFLEYLAVDATIVRRVTIDEMKLYSVMDIFEQDRNLIRTIWRS